VTTAPVSVHFFGSSEGGGYYGNFSVLLTVTDSDNSFEGMKTALVLVNQAPLHDVAVQSVRAVPPKVAPGGKVNITVVIKNQGTFDENFTLRVIYRAPVATLGTFSGQSFTAGATRTFSVTMDTTGLAEGLYEVIANVTIPKDDVPENNVYEIVVNVSTDSPTSVLYLAAGGLAVVGSLVTVGAVRRRRKKPLPD
jgi:hypothetical protein